MKYETTVTDIIQRTHAVKSFRFPRPPDFVFKPGQFLFIAIKDGQEELKKHFSISSSPTDAGYVEFTKKLTGNRFSNALDALKVGSWARIDGPYGGFTFEGEYEKIAMLTGGIGITPLMSICKFCTDRGLGTSISLLYSSHTTADIAFRAELDELQARNKNLKLVLSITDVDPSWNGVKGRINAEMVKKEIPDFNERIFFVSGPVSMVQDMVGMLKQMDIKQERIKEDLFTGFDLGR